MPNRSAAVATPFWDAVLTGGLSIVGMAGLLAYLLFFGDDFGGFRWGDWIVLSVLINTTHFTVSYRLLYVSKESILKHRWSAIYVPAVLFSVLLFAVFGPYPGITVQLTVLVSGLYLAWHYTGQAWGMVASFAHITGLTFTDRERWCIRFGPRVLLVYHLHFAFADAVPPASWMSLETWKAGYDFTFWVLVSLAVISLFVGAWGYLSARSRGQSIPVRTVFPWFALYLWYPFWYLVPGGFLWVQLSHALQYLMFPLRVEVNRMERKAPRTSQEKLLRLTVLFIILAISGGMLFEFREIATMISGPGWYSEPHARLSFQALASCLAIHHYFIDGAVWKLRNPEVRRELFSHLEPQRETATT